MVVVWWCVGVARLRPQLLFFRSDPLPYFLRQIFSLESELADWAIWLAAELLRPICLSIPALWFQDKPPCPAFFMVLGVKLGPHDHMTSTCWPSCCPAPSFYFMPVIMLPQMMLGSRLWLQGKSAPPPPQPCTGCFAMVVSVGADQLHNHCSCVHFVARLLLSN